MTLISSARGFHAWVAACVLLACHPVAAQTIVWSGADVAARANTNWSDANNWTGGTPGKGTNIDFFDPGASATQGAVDNIVDGNTTIFSLQFGNTNGFHTTLINPGVALIISNNGANTFLSAGTGTDNGESHILYATVTGGGTLTAVSTNTGSAVSIQQAAEDSGSHMATLDLSGLAGFNLTAGRLLVGGAGGTSSNDNRPSGTFYLAGTNVLRLNGAAPAIDAGDCPMNGGTEYIYLGRSNSVVADSITIARQKCTATMEFNSASPNPTLTLSGNTNSRVTALAIGDFSAQSTSGSTCFGTVNLTGGTVDAQVNTCYVGKGQSGSGTGTATGILSIGAGVFNVDTLEMAYVGSSGATATVTGTVNVTNGTLAVNSNLVMGYNAGSPATASATLNISNGTVFASNIATAGGVAAITLKGGLLAVSNSLGSPSAPLNSLAIANAGTLELWVVKDLTNAAFDVISSDNTGVIDIAALPIILNYPTEFPLIACSHASGVSFVMGTLPGVFQGYISNDNSSAVWLVITNGPPLPRTDQWAGAVNNNWDDTTLNWSNNDSAVAYSEGDIVLFNDLAQSGAVNIVGATRHTPASWSVSNNVVNYTFAGTNGVAGSAGLVKSGSASLTLSETGDTFSGGITVNGGTLTLNEPAGNISGGLTIAAGATAQIGGGLPSGAIMDHGSLVFAQTGADIVSASISGGGTLTQEGADMLELTGTNTYTGDTLVLQGTLALLGSINSPTVVVNNGTFDVSSLSSPTVTNLNMTNGALTVGGAIVHVSTLHLGGQSNTINVAAVPASIFAYPTNITLLQSASGISGYNFVLGALPSAKPAYTGTLSQSGNALVLTLASGPLAIVQTTVTFSPTNAGWVLNPAFCGLSYEKSELTGGLFASTDTSLIKMFGQIAPAVLRIGGNSVNTTCWGGVSNQTPITPSEVSAFAGFVKALPANWRVIYGIDMANNSPTNCAAEAAYVANALGSSLLGFEIGNEPDLYYENGLRPASYTFSDFVAEWNSFAAAITNTVPGWAATNGGNGWTLTGPASASNTKGYTVPFAGDEADVIALLTQHYYRANGQSPSSTIGLLLQPDTSLPGTVSNLVVAATSARLPLGFRMDECGSFYNGGAPNVSDAYGTALWAIDYMFTLALNGTQGMNFHGGGDGTGYTPIADNGTAVVQARPEFYGLKMFSLVSQGSAIPSTVSLASNINFTAYGVRRANGAISAILNNKDTNNEAQVTISLGTNVTSAQFIELTGPALDSTNGYTIGGAEIEPDGSWAGGVQAVIPAVNGQVTVIVPPISAVLLDPLTLPDIGTNIVFSVRGNQLNLAWPSNYTGWLLQSNSIGLALTNDWFQVPGSATTNAVELPIGSGGQVFYRLAYP